MGEARRVKVHPVADDSIFVSGLLLRLLLLARQLVVDAPDDAQARDLRAELHERGLLLGAAAAAELGRCGRGRHALFEKGPVLSAHVGTGRGRATQGTHGVRGVLREDVGLGLGNFGLDGLFALVPLASRRTQGHSRAGGGAAVGGGGGGGGGELPLLRPLSLVQSVARRAVHVQHLVLLRPVLHALRVLRVLLSLNAHVHLPRVIDKARRALHEALPGRRARGHPGFGLCPDGRRPPRLGPNTLGRLGRVRRRPGNLRRARGRAQQQVRAQGRPGAGRRARRLRLFPAAAAPRVPFRPAVIASVHGAAQQGLPPEALLQRQGVPRKVRARRVPRLAAHRGERGECGGRGRGGAAASAQRVARQHARGR